MGILAYAIHRDMGNDSDINSHTASQVELDSLVFVQSYHLCNFYLTKTELGRPFKSFALFPLYVTICRVCLAGKDIALMYKNVLITNLSFIL